MWYFITKRHLNILAFLAQKATLVYQGEVWFHCEVINGANYKFNPNKPGIFQWQSVDDVFLMVVD